MIKLRWKSVPQTVLDTYGPPDNAVAIAGKDCWAVLQYQELAVFTRLDEPVSNWRDVELADDDRGE